MTNKFFSSSANATDSSNTLPPLWQDIVDLVAEIAQVPAALIMRGDSKCMEVLVSSRGDDNPYHVGDKEPISDDLYCHHVATTGLPLHVRNALQQDEWKNNPDIKIGMVAYYGIPIHSPNGECYGTFCILDRKERYFDSKITQLMSLLGRSIETSLTLQDENQKLSQEIQQRDHYHSLTNLPTQSQAQHAYENKDYRHLTILFIRNIQAYDIRDNLGLLDAQRLTKVFYQQVKAILPSNADIYYISNSEMILVQETQKGDDLQGEAEQLASQLHALFSHPIALNKKSITVPISIGCAFSYDKEFSFSELLDMATVACTQGTSTGKTFHIFNPEQQEKRKHYYEVTQQFSSAFANSEFYLNYQPIISALTDEVVGCEALVRWKNAKFGMIYPDEFIPLAEQCGAMNPLGDWIIDEALRCLHGWQKEQQPNPDFYVSINISSTQLCQDDFADKVIGKLKAQNINPSSILLEFTETALLSNEAQVMSHCQKLAKAGVKIALDDFGTGFSSLSHLHDFPIDVVKIDKSFIFNLNKSQKSSQLVKGILSLGKLLDLQIVAEGVESQDVCSHLQFLKCDFMQGYYWNRPMGQTEFEKKYIITAKKK
ncbi:sensor domain-containing phosphodiesterase [Vibrio rumoiensis]|uniref:Diguanylate cyclase n=1 Tax=Vibrio rumoiensis 1S-45 TaxID=1188252 RepID=A0A1E5E5C9_9VIBR|nr:EAL domain-containing protein [Vibrio rumoiensis]OEF28608.1 hypothetical protein A1QC_04895 [Vibrio rumoiensis 1S-45]